MKLTTCSTLVMAMSRRHESIWAFEKLYNKMDAELHRGGRLLHRDYEDTSINRHPQQPIRFIDRYYRTDTNAAQYASRNTLSHIDARRSVDTRFNGCETSISIYTLCLVLHRHFKAMRFLILSCHLMRYEISSLSRSEQCCMVAYSECLSNCTQRPSTSRPWSRDNASKCSQ